MKKLISMLIAVVMVASLFTVIAIPTSADEATNYASLYTGEMDTSWYNKDDIKDEYHITSAAQLAGFSYIVGYEFQRFEGVTFYLDTDIVWNNGTFSIDDKGNPLYNGVAVDTSDESVHKAGDEVLNFWEPIGDYEQSPGNGPSGDGQFYGTFDGQGHTVSGLYFNDPSVAYVGFFTIFCGKELKNLSVINSYLGGHSRLGSFAGFAYNVWESGTNQDIVGSRFSNLYSDTYIVLKSPDSTDARAGGIFGMIRPKKLIEGQDPVGRGHITELEKCWFNGVIYTTYVNQHRYNGGIVGVAAIDNAKTAENKNYINFTDCLMSGSFYYGENDSAATNTIRMGSFLGNIYHGRATLTNCIVAIKDTNMTAENGFQVTKTDAATGESIKITARDVVGTLEQNPAQVVYKNVFAKLKGIFADAAPLITTPNVETNDVYIEGAYTVDNDLALALVTLGGADSAFDLSDPSAPAIKNLKTTCDSVNPDDLNKPEDTDPPVVETDPPVVETDPPVDDTDPPAGGDDPVVTTPQVTTPTTQPQATEPTKGCGGFTAFAAVLALVAVSAAAVVIKKK